MPHAFSATYPVDGRGFGCARFAWGVILEYQMLSEVVFFVALLAPAVPATYKAEVEKWRAEREARLKADDGWLTVTGLFWLKQGENTIGTTASDRIVLPARSSPPQFGSIYLQGGKAELRVRPGVPALLNGKPVDRTVLAPDKDRVTIGDVTFFVIERGKRTGIRLKDRNSEIRRNFAGLDWFPIDSAWRIEARWTPYPAPKKIFFSTMTGDKQEASVPGYATFAVGGREYRLEPVTEDDQLWFVFRDRTAGRLTYPAARFLYAAAPKDGRVILDFNRAYNPPCAFTPYSTCPLPPPGNRLPVEITAGEKKYKGGSH